MNDEPKQIAYDITFHGIVQGVGFRYTAYELARSYPALSGWVKNHWNGSVEMHVQGDEQSIEKYLLELTRESRLARLIDSVSRKTGTVLPGEKGFRIEK